MRKIGKFKPIILLAMACNVPTLLNASEDTSMGSIRSGETFHHSHFFAPENGVCSSATVTKLIREWNATGGVTKRVFSNDINHKNFEFDSSSKRGAFKVDLNSKFKDIKKIEASINFETFAGTKGTVTTSAILFVDRTSCGESELVIRSSKVVTNITN